MKSHEIIFWAYLLTVLVLSCIQLFATLWTVAHQAPLSMGCPRQKYWSGLPFPPTGDLPNPGVRPTCPGSPALRVDSLPLSHRGISPVPKLFHCDLSNARSIVTEDRWLSLESTYFPISHSDGNCSLFCSLLHWACRRNECPFIPHCSFLCIFSSFSTKTPWIWDDQVFPHNTPCSDHQFILMPLLNFGRLLILALYHFLLHHSSWWYQWSSSPIWSS